MRPTSTVYTVEASCQRCPWEDNARGALGRAALHHDATGHEVVTEVVTVVTYGDEARRLEEQGQQQLEV